MQSHRLAMSPIAPPRVRLSEVGAVLMGQSPPGTTYNDQKQGLPFFQGTRDFGYRHPTPRVHCEEVRRVAEPGDLLFSVRAPIGRINVADRRCGIGRGLAAVRARHASDARYLEYGLRALHRSWDTLEGNGSVFGNATRRDLEETLIPWPSAQRRRSISDALGTLDDKIESNWWMSETLDQMARAIFEDWFVKFGPTRAKMEGRRRYLSECVWSLFPSRLVQSEVGRIPSGWSVRPFDAVADYRNGLALQRFRPVGDEPSLPVVKIAQLRSGAADGKESASARIAPECVLDDGDVVFSWSGSLLVKLWCGGRAALNQHLFKVTSRRFPRWFYYHHLLERLPAFQRIASSKVTTMGHIRRRHLGEEMCAVPDDRLLEAAGGVMEALVRAQIENSVSMRKLAALRDRMVPKLLSGELQARG